MNNRLNNDLIQQKILEQSLPFSYRHTVDDWLFPIASQIALGRQVLSLSAPHECKSKPPLILGVQGTQGSGKSTCSEFLKLIFESHFQLSTAVLSIDDFYLTHQQRAQLAHDIHPLLQTRGVPGTHDIPLAINTIDQLVSANPDSNILIPRFDKASDDRAPKAQWSGIHGVVDIIILEGWCVGLTAEDPSALATPINALEAEEDPDGRWRTFANENLRDHYPKLFQRIDRLLVLKAPSFDCVLQWRLKQEHKLKDKLAQNGADTNNRVMGDEGVERFIAHYQRLTHHALRTLPPQADWCLHLDANQKIHKMNSAKDHLLVVTDLDGTLLDHHNYSWQAAQPALDLLHEFSVPVVINTSKTRDEVMALQKKIGIAAPFIVENGSALYLPINCAQKLNIQSLTEKNIRINTDHPDYICLVFGAERKYIVDKVYALRDEFSYQFEGYSDWSLAQLMEKTGLGDDQAKLSMRRNFSEPLIWQDSDENFTDFSQRIAQLGFAILRGGRFVHILGKTDKAQPVIVLTELLSQQRSYKLQKTITLKTLCLGDSPNDGAMLAIADYPVWIKSPVAPYPNYPLKNTPYYSEGYGPVGWTEAINNVYNVR